jgi:uncharacterized protein (TIGR02611 family)
MEQLKSTWRKTPRTARRAIVLIIGALLIVAGIFMLVLPGPGWATIFLGLAVLASEFERAEKLRAAVIHRFKSVIDKARSKPRR